MTPLQNKDTNNKEDKKMINQYDIEIMLDEAIAFINGKYKFSNFFSMSYKDKSYIQIMKPKFYFVSYSEKEIKQYNALWELKLGYYKITREV